MNNQLELKLNTKENTMSIETLDPDEILSQASMMHSVFFEGIDKVGKSSVMRELYRALGYKITCFDRAYASTYVYDLLRRHKVLNKIHLAEDCFNALEMCASFNQFGKGATLVYVYASMEVVSKRMQENDHEAYYEGSLETFESAITIIHRLCPELRIITLDTTNMTAKQAAEFLAKELLRI